MLFSQKMPYNNKKQMGGSPSSDAVLAAVPDCAYSGVRDAATAATLHIAVQQGGCESCNKIAKKMIKLPAAKKQSRATTASKPKSKPTPKPNSYRKQRGGATSCNSANATTNGASITGSAVNYDTLISTNRLSADAILTAPLAKTVSPYTPTGSELYVLSQDPAPYTNTSQTVHFPPYAQGVPFQMGGRRVALTSKKNTKASIKANAKPKPKPKSKK